MKVPVYEEPQAHPDARVPESVHFERQGGYDALARGIDSAVSGASTLYDKYQHEARSADVANGLAAYANDATDKFHGAPSDPSTEVVAGGTPAIEATPAAIDAATAAGDVDTGFLGTRGKAAAAAEKPLFDSLAQRRDQIAAGFTDPETKKLFLARVQQYDLELRAKAESHVGQQVEVAKEDAAKNISDAAVRSAAADPENDALAATLFGEARGAVHGLGRGADFDALHDRELRADIAGTRIDALLNPPGDAPPNAAKAREVLEANREVLGHALKPLEARVDQAETSVKATDAANRIIGEAAASRSNPFAEPDPAVAEKALEQLPGPVRAKANALVTEGLTRLKTSADENRKLFVRGATTAFNKDPGAFFGSDLANQLNDVDPDKYADLLDKLEVRRRRSRENKSDRNREQRETNAHALELFLRQGSDLNAAPDAVDTFLENLKGAEVDSIGRLELQQAADRARTVVDKGQATNETAFVGDALAALKGWRPSNPKQATAWRAAAEADARNVFATFIEDNEGKAPTKEQSAKLRSEIVQKAFQATLQSGRKPTDEQIQAAGGAAAVGGGGSRRPAAAAAEPAKKSEPQKKTLKSYLWSPDRKQRVPVYTDGSRGPVEKVK